MNDDKGSIPSAIASFVDQTTDPNTVQMFASYMSQNSELLPQTEMWEQKTDQNREKERIQNRLGGFNPKDNDVWREITQRFGANIKQPELLSIAQVLASSANVKLDRDAKRRKGVLIKWFEENWETIRPFLDYVVLEDSGMPPG